MMFSRLAERLRAVARVADVRPRKPKPDPMVEVDAALGLTEREQSGSETAKPGQIAPSGKLPPITHPKRTWTTADFVNLRAAKLNVGDKIAAAERLGVTLKHINMLLKVESGGMSFDTRGRPIILFEPHIFHRRTGGRWSPSDFSYSRWGARPYPKSFDGRWQQMEAAAVRDPVAALESASWGLFQVMGFHWQALGYADAYDFALMMARSESEQLDAMVRFIVANRLKGALQKCRADDPDSCRDFARGYNGGGYEKNNYHTKLARALR